MSTRRGGEEDGAATETIEGTDREAQAANKALELLGKTPELRLYIDQIEKGDALAGARIPSS